MTLLLTHSTEIQLPALPRPITDYAWFELASRDARWVLYGRLSFYGGWSCEIIASYLPEAERHIARAVLHKLDAIHLSACTLMGVHPWMEIKR